MKKTIITVLAALAFSFTAHAQSPINIQLTFRATQGYADIQRNYAGISLPWATSGWYSATVPLTTNWTFIAAGVVPLPQFLVARNQSTNITVFASFDHGTNTLCSIPPGTPLLIPWNPAYGTDQIGLRCQTNSAIIDVTITQQ